MKNLTIKLFIAFAALLLIAALFTSCSKDSNDVTPPNVTIPQPKFVLTKQMLLGDWIWYGNKSRSFQADKLVQQDASDNWFIYNYFVDNSNNILVQKTHQKLKGTSNYVTVSLTPYDTIPNCYISGDTLYSQWVSFSTGKIIKQFECKRK